MINIYKEVDGHVRLVIHGHSIDDVIWKGEWGFSLTEQMIRTCLEKVRSLKKRFLKLEKILEEGLTN